MRRLPEPATGVLAELGLGGRVQVSVLAHETAR
jgi:hypothetical protein